MGRGTRGKRSMKKGHVYRTHFPKVALFQQLFKGSALALRCCYNGMKDEEKALEKRLGWRSFLPLLKALTLLCETIKKCVGPSRRRSEVRASISLRSWGTMSLILPRTASISRLEPSSSEGDCQENWGNVLSRQTLENGNQLVHLFRNYFRRSLEEIKYRVHCRTV